ncbi:hypothetical protein ZWY2020_020232 [Hordeum vulgare]|nr:hypothetical protein ZWY2020_020232 [Hordeum vulgare]
MMEPSRPFSVVGRLDDEWKMPTSAQICMVLTMRVLAWRPTIRTESSTSPQCSMKCPSDCVQPREVMDKMHA